MATPKRATSSTTRSKRTTAKAQETKTLQQSNGNVEELIRFRAYQLYEQRGRTHGLDLEDWLRAESEIIPGPRAHSA